MIGLLGLGGDLEERIINQACFLKISDQITRNSSVDAVKSSVLFVGRRRRIGRGRPRVARVGIEVSEMISVSSIEAQMIRKK